MPTDIRQLTKRYEDLRAQRATWDPLCIEIRDYIYPDAGDFEGEDARRGEKRYGKIINATATASLDILAAGMQGGISSPSVPWFRLSTSDPKLDESANVKQWLADVQRKMLMVFAKSEVYNSLHAGYAELAAFGTSCSIITPTEDARIVSYRNQTFGGYYLAANDGGLIDTVYRRLRLNAIDMVERWGEKCTRGVRECVEHGSYYETFEVIHAIEPRRDRDPNKADQGNMPWRSIYFQPGADHVLAESGFRSFPATCPRWHVVGNAVYGRGPGAKALGAVKRLQHKEFRQAQAIDYLSNPPIVVPREFEGRLDELKPGSIIFTSQTGKDAGVRSAYEVKADVAALGELISRDEQAIRECFYTNLFQMVASTAERERTAYEVAQLEQEKMMVLGPVLERLSMELFDPLITTTFDALVMTEGALPPPPDELNGMQLTVEYVGTLMQAQKASATNSIDRLVTHLGMIAQAKPDVVDKFDADKSAELYADMLGVPPELIIPGDKVAIIRRQRAEQQQAAMQQQQQIEMAKAGGSTAPAPSAGNGYEPAAGSLQSLQSL